jgi:hypothetical protein
LKALHDTKHGDSFSKATVSPSLSVLPVSAHVPGPVVTTLSLIDMAFLR